MRAVILDEDGSALLVRFEIPRKLGVVLFWAAPGGGIEDGEDDHTALARELEEEVGLRSVEPGPLIWTRTHIFPMTAGYDGQREHFYLVQVPRFEPQPLLTAEQLRAEHVTGIRWWTPDELAPASASTLFAPSRLPELLEQLRTIGPPPAPIDVGV